MSLWDKAYENFRQELYDQKEDPSAIESFLQDKASLDDAQHSAARLRDDSNRKYGTGDSRGKGISGKWIVRILENLGKFISSANVAMDAAPESIGLAWFAIKQVLNAIQNDYKLYTTFNTALNDITEMTVLVQTYDKIFQADETQGGGGIYHELFVSIIDVYTSILDFSYAVKKHITASKVSKLKHALQDTVGALNQIFEKKTATIQAQKKKVIQYSEAAFQRKTSDQLGDMKGELSVMQVMMREAFEFHQQSSSEWKEILSELKASNKPSHRDLAVDEHEKHMKRLNPWLDASTGIMSARQEERASGTCVWINEVLAYTAWRDSDKSAILCVTGEAGSGKSVLGAYICEVVVNQTCGRSLGLYVSSYTRSSDKAGEALERIENTIIRRTYEHAARDTDDEMLLQRCNGLFTQPKQTKSKDGSGRSRDTGPSARSRIFSSDHPPDMVDFYPELVEALERRMVIVIDDADSLSDTDQAKLIDRLMELQSSENIHVRFLVLCRPSSQIRLKMSDELICKISMADHNGSDIRLIIAQGLEMLPGLAQTERAEVENVITQKTGHRIAYVEQVALPFLRTPFQRPVASWLKDLSDNVNETYHQHLRQLSPNYHELLRTALAWALVAQVPPSVEEIMDAYSREYLDGAMDDERGKTKSSLNLYREQIQKAGGPFLEVLDDESVTLADAQTVRSFCSQVLEIPADGTNEGLVCTRCSAAKGNEFTLSISEKEEHLNIAIICLKHLNSPSFQSRFFPGMLEEARSRAQNKPSNQACVEGTIEKYEHTLVNSNDTLASERREMDSKDVEQTLESGSLDIFGKNALQAHVPDEPPIEEIDEDESVFSDQDREDFEEPYDDYWDNTSERSRQRYEWTNWFYHVRQAKRLWPADERKANAGWQELSREMERFFLSEPVAFELWKLAVVWYQSEDWPPLAFAALYGLTSLAESLFANGVKMMDLTPEGFSALSIAAESPDRLDTLQFFLGREADPNFEGPKIPAFHHWLLLDADATCVRELLGSHASCSSISTISHDSALHCFASCGSDPEVLSLLLENPKDTEDRAEINIRDGEGATPLHHLLRRQKIPLELLEMFLARGADVNVDSLDSRRPLAGAALWGEIAAIEKIIGFVTDVDDDDKWGSTALHLAAHTGQKETVQFLLEHSADVNRKDKHNRTPLLCACTPDVRILQNSSHAATAELLMDEQIKRGALFSEINVCSKSGRTALREAAGRGFVQVVTAILKQMGPEDREWINKRDERRGRSPLHSAATHGRAEVIVVLLRHGADPNIRDGKINEGKTCLELCLDQWANTGSKRYEDAIALLIDACAEEVKRSKLLLTTAAIQGSTLILVKLANMGLDLNQPDAYGWTPRQLASQFGHDEAMEFISTTLASKALRPAEWLLPEDSKYTTLQDDGRRVVHQSVFRFCISANQPVPALPVYYFEIELLDNETGESKESTTNGDEEMPEIALGFCTATAKTIEFPGWPLLLTASKVQSWAYHSDEIPNSGCLCSSDQKKWRTRFGKHYGPGDTVGAGVELETRRIFFTRNGARIADGVFEDIKGRLFPVIGLSDKIQLRTNFGSDPNQPFKWDEANYAVMGIRGVSDRKIVDGIEPSP